MTQQHTSDPRPPFPYVRLIIAIILSTVILFLFVSNKIDLVVFVGFVLSLLGINFLERLFSSIDEWDSWIEHRLKDFLLPLSRFTVGRNILAFGHKIHFLTYPVLVLTILALIFHTPIGSVIGPVNDTVCLNVSLPWCSSGIGVTDLKDNVSIGLIVSDHDGGTFDQSSLRDQEKNVESLIFQENRTSCVGSHITLAVVTMLSRTIEDPSGSADVGLANLEGAYIAQKDYNDGNPHVRLCLAIANLGTSATAIDALPQIIMQIKQFSHYDHSFRGVVGMPYSAQVQSLLDKDKILSWKQENIPIVSLSATSDNFSNVKNFYRVVSPDQVQAKAQAKFFCTNHNRLAKNKNSLAIDVFYDPRNPYSNSLSADFEEGLGECGMDYKREVYTIGNAQSIQNAVDNAIHNDDTFIFFAGYNSDQDILEDRIQENTLRNASRSPSDITVLSGDGLSDFTNTDHNAFTSIYTTAYTYPLKNDTPEAEQFIKTYKEHFLLPVFANSIPSYTLLPPDSIRGYDATKAFTSTLIGIKTLPTQEELNSYLAEVQFQSFDTNFIFHGDKTANVSDPAQIPVAIMCITNTHNIHLVATYGTDGSITLEKGNGKGFCS